MLTTNGCLWCQPIRLILQAKPEAFIGKKKGGNIVGMANARDEECFRYLEENTFRTTSGYFKKGLES